ncbi:MAG TPA: SCO family protein [Candidatus Binataceae bacterium]|nr:SCO family protein [Candidatus Binataceae bacterium]
MNSTSVKDTGKPCIVATIMAFASLVFLLVAGCNRNSSSATTASSADEPYCLPSLTLTNKFGTPVNLVSLKGKPLLFDFFYTSCPGPCLVLTARMRKIAEQMGPALGSQVTFVSVTVDPEHDHPAQLLSYAKEQNADRKGWMFLTGTPAQIDALMSRFRLRRQREADGSIDHVLEFFLVGSNGHLLYQYLYNTSPERITGDLAAAEHHAVASATGYGGQMSHENPSA